MTEAYIGEENTTRHQTGDSNCGCHCEGECHCSCCQEKEPYVFDESDIEDFIANLNDWD